MRILVFAAETIARLPIQLRRQGIGCEEAISCQDLVASARQGTFDAVLIESGNVQAATAVIRALRGAGGVAADLPILVILATPGPGAIAGLLDLGADDAVSIACEGQELLARLRAVVRRSRGFARPLLSCGPLGLDQLAKTASIHGRSLALTPKEFEVLEMLVLRKGRVLSKSMLLERIYADPEGPECRAIDVLVCRLRKKLLAAGEPGLIGTAWGTGYVLREPEPAHDDLSVAA